MFSRFFGQRNPEKDIERIVVDLHGANICRVIALAVGWKINEGTTQRFLQHSSAFQIDDGGNARGVEAVDLQQGRGGATQVASGANAAIGGGYANTASGEDSSIPGGNSNKASGDKATVIGGLLNEANNDYSVAMGSGGKVNNDNQMVHGNYQGDVGDNQASRFVLKEEISHSGADWVPLYTGSDSGVVVPTDTVMTFIALIVGTTEGCTKSFGYKIEGVVENDGGTTTLLASTVTTLYEDDASFDCRAQANDTDDILEIQMSDADGTGDSVMWAGRVDTIEVTHAA